MAANVIEPNVKTKTFSALDLSDDLESVENSFGDLHENKKHDTGMIKLCPLWLREKTTRRQGPSNVTEHHI